MADKERMSNVDAAWLKMDAPNNLMMIIAVMILEDPLALDRLQELLSVRLLKYKRFIQRVEMDPRGAYWSPDPFFNMESHVLRVSLPGTGGKDELQRYLASLVCQQLDGNKPLWQFQINENYEGGSAIIFRIHHCIADGISLMGVLQDLTDLSADASPFPADSEEAAAEEGFFDSLNSAMAKTLEASSKLLAGSMEVLFNPTLMVDYTRIAAVVAGEAAELALMPNDTPTRLKGRPGAIKRVAWAEPLPLENVKALGKAMGVSVNDVLMSCVAGAIRQYLLEHGDPVEDVGVRAMIPVNLRPEGKVQRLGNRFGLVPLLLPIGIEEPIERLLEVRERMEELKHSYRAGISMGVLGLAGLCPPKLHRQILDLFSKKATAVMTNVPGPRQQLFMAGSRVKQQMFWVPQSGDIGVGISILSYSGKVQFGVITDQKLVPDPDHLVGHFLPELEKLMNTLLRTPEICTGEPAEVIRALAHIAQARGVPVPAWPPLKAAPHPAEKAPRKEPAKRITPASRRPKPAPVKTVKPVKKVKTPGASASPKEKAPPPSPAKMKKKGSAFSKLKGGA
jgi:diacylglycerol O-acyltransferase